VVARLEGVAAIRNESLELCDVRGSGVDERRVAPVARVDDRKRLERAAQP
jgi:hypothetical protein